MCMGHTMRTGVDHVMYSGDNFGLPQYKDAVDVKYGGNRTAWAEASVGRLARAGFNTLGSWSSARFVILVCFVLMQA